MAGEEKPERKPGRASELRKALGEFIAAYRRLLTRRVIAMTIIVAAVLFLVILAFRLHAALSQDLVLVIAPSGEAISLRHGESQNVSFTLSTNNYFLCEAQCTYELRDIETNTTIAESVSLNLQDSNASISYRLDAPAKGEGQQIFQLAVACANVQKRTCARSGETHRATALVTVDYGLTDAELAARERAAEQIPAFLSIARDNDLAVQELSAGVEALRDGEEIGLDGLEGRVAPSQQAQDQLVAEAQRLRGLWEAQEYTAIIASLAGANATLNASKAAIEGLHAYVDAQHALVNETQQAIANEDLGEALRAFETLGDAAAAESARTAHQWLEGFARNLSRYPAENALMRRSALKEAISLRENLTLHAADLLSGAAKSAEVIVSLERERIAAQNATEPKNEHKNQTGTNQTNTTNETANTTGPSLNARIHADIMNITPQQRFAEAASALESQCAELEQVRTELASRNLTPLNETGRLLSACAAMQNQTSPLPKIEARLAPAQLPQLNLSSRITTILAAPQTRCCAFGECRPCAERERTPVLFVHGHSMNQRNAPEYSMQAFMEYQRLLQEDGILIDAGALTPYDTYASLPALSWGKSPLPVSVSATYYYDAYLSGSSYILSAAKSESIDTYAIRLKEMVSALKARTGSDKITIVTHSMGGLVARRYLQLFGTGDVEKLVMIAPPSHGVNASVARICPLFGADKECEELKAGSSMLAKLNDPSRQPDIPVYVIEGRGCDMNGKDGDGIVTLESAALPGVHNIIVNGTCPGATALFHTGMLDAQKHPEIYRIVRGLLQEN